MADDYLLAAISGALEGFNNTYIPMKKKQQEYLLNEQQKEKDFLRENYIKPEDLPQNVRSQFGDKPVRKETLSLFDKKKEAQTVGQLYPSNAPRPQEFTPEFNNMTPDQVSKVLELRKKTNTQPDFRNASGLRREFINRPEVKEYQVVSTSVKSMEKLLDEGMKPGNNNKVALDQALVTMYNKLTDPNSVVRESEYARTPENLPTVNRISGALRKIQEGGAGLTDDDRKALVLGAKIIANERGRTFQSLKNEYRSLSSDYGVDPKLVIGTIGEFTPFSGISSPEPAQQGLPSVGQTFNGAKVLKIRKVK